MAANQSPSRLPELPSQMLREALEAPTVVARQRSENRSRVLKIATHLKRLNPRAIVTGARGSSDNAATFARYLIETKTGILTSSTGLSVSSVYAAQPRHEGVVFLAISQSGRSPDLLASVESARAGGAMVLALVNDESSPLASLAHEVLPMRAGPETSIAATKTYLASVAAIADLIAAWTGEAALDAALSDLPEKMLVAAHCDWSEAITDLKSTRDLYVVGRGLGFGLAQEAALKFKETSGLHAEAFSAAEVLHGPMALVRKGFSILMFSQNDETRPGMKELAANLARARASLLVAGFETDGARNLPTAPAHPALEPILMAQSFYTMAESLSRARGFDPDRPPHLNKVTETT